jgi:hypothetical protein
MEKRFDTDNFEQMLREKSDEFRMYPSKRVWHSIYNDLHPGRKWPSVAMSMMLVITLMLIGSLNTQDNTSRKDISTTASNPSENNLNNNVAGHDQTDINDRSALPVTGDQANNKLQSSLQILAMDQYIRGQQLFIDINRIRGNEPTSTSSSRSVATDPTALKTIGSQNSSEFSPVIKNEPSTFRVIASENNSVSNNTDLSFNKEIVSGDKSSAAKAKDNIQFPIQNAQSKISSGQSTEERSWMEDYVLHNKNNRAKWKDRTTMGFYVTPSVGYRNLSDNMRNPAAATAYTASISSANNREISQKPSLNLEAGVNLAYSFAKNLSLKTGVQVNYTSYGINADETHHPIVTTLMLNDLDANRPILTTRTTTLANGTGLQSVTVHNTTYQLSLPVGLAVKLAGTNKMEWHAGATIQPSFIFGGTTNFISTDHSAYVSDASLLRRWNMNTGVETYLSYKLSGYTLQVGPQFRYQLMSTYSDKYIQNENLYNVGIKFGLVKGF